MYAASSASGSLSVSGIITVANVSGSSGTLNVAGGSLTAASLTNNDKVNFSAGAISLNSGAGTLTNNGQLKVTGGTSANPLVLSGNLSNAGTTTVDSGKALTVTGSTSNAGTMTVNGGVTTGSFTNTGALAINSGAKLTTGAFSQTAGSTTLAGGTIDPPLPINVSGGSFGGFGTVQGNLNVSGANTILSVGPGTLTIEGFLTQTQGTFLDFTLNSKLEVTQGYDVEGVSFVFDFGSTAPVSPFLLSDFLLADAGSSILTGDTFSYVDSLGVSHTLAYNDLTGYLSADNGGNGGNGGAAPEPGELALLLAAFGAMGFVGSRRRKTFRV